MATKKQEEILRLTFEAEGQQVVSQISSDVKVLGDAASDAEKQAAALLDEFAATAKLEKAASQIRAVSAAALENQRKLQASQAAIKGLVAEERAATATEQQWAGELAKSRTALDALKNGTAGFTGTSRELAAAQKAARAEIAKVNTEYRAAAAAQKAAAAALEAERSSASRLSAAREKNLASSRALRGELEAAGVSTKSLAATERELAARVEKTGAAMRDLAAKTRAQRTEQEKATAAAKARAAAEREAEAQTKATIGTVKSFATNLLRLTGIASAVSAALSAIGLGNLFGGAIKSAANLERAFDGVQAVSGASKEEVRQFGEAAERATAKAGVSALDAAGALGELARATGSARSAIEALPATISLAQAGGIELAQSATIVTTTLTQFGLAAEEAGRVADVLARAANSTTADVQGLGLALSYAAPLARQLGMNLEQTTAVIGALADQGFRGERAGTALRNVFAALADPTSEFRQALLGAGIAGDDFVEIITGLAKAGDAGKRALLSLDAEARPAILSLVNSGGAGLRVLKADLDNAKGSAEETARVMGDNLATAWDRFLGTIDAGRRKLVQPLLEPLKVQADEAAVSIRKFIASADFQRFSEAISTFVLSATRAITDFIRDFDFQAASNKANEFAENVKGYFAEVKNGITALGSFTATAFRGIAIVFDGAAIAIRASAAVITGTFATILRGAAKLEKFNALDRFLSTLTGAASESERLNEAAEALLESNAVNYDKTGESVDRLIKDLERLFEGLEETNPASEKSSAAVGGIGAAANDSAPKVAGLAKELSLVPDYAHGAADAVRVMPGPLQDLGRDSVLAAQSMTRLEQGLQPIDPMLELLRANLASSSVAFAKVVNSADRTPQSMAAAEAAFSSAALELRDYELAANGAKDGTTRFATAAAALGIKSLFELQSAADKARAGLEGIRVEFQLGARSQESVNQAFEIYAQRQLELAQASGASARARILAEVQVQAALSGNLDKLDEMLAKYDGLANAPLPPPPSAAPVVDYSRAMADAAANTQNAADSTENYSNQANGLLANLQQAIDNARGPLAAISDEAAGFFDRIVLDLETTRTEIGAGAGFDTFAENLVIASDTAMQAVENQRASLKAATDALQQYADGAETAFGETRFAARFTAQELAVLEQQVDSGTTQFTLLGEQELQPLRSALDAARQRVQALEDQAKSAREALMDMANASQDALDEGRGNQSAIEDRRFQEQLRRIDDLAKQGGAAAAAEAQRARALAQEEHSQKLREIEERKREEMKADDEVADNRRRKNQSSMPSSSGGAAGIDVNFKLNGNAAFGANIKDLSAAERQQLAQQLAPHLVNEFARSARNAGLGGR